jgi:hypothetical protein
VRAATAQVMVVVAAAVDVLRGVVGLEILNIC